MIVAVNDFKEWVAELDDVNYVCLDGGTAVLVEVDYKLKRTGAWLEIGGMPEGGEPA